VARKWPFRYGHRHDSGPLKQNRVEVLEPLGPFGKRMLLLTGFMEWIPEGKRIRNDKDMKRNFEIQTENSSFWEDSHGYGQSELIFGILIEIQSRSILGDREYGQMQIRRFGCQIVGRGVRHEGTAHFEGTRSSDLRSSQKFCSGMTWTRGRVAWGVFDAYRARGASRLMKRDY
jgi:hypothetical protein